MPKAAKDVTLDDVQVMGEWNFTLQSNTPLFWIKSGSLDRYLLRFRAQSPCSPSTFGLVFHAEADGPGTDGASFWIERTPQRGTLGEGPKKRYILAGDGLESKPVITREFPDTGGTGFEDVQILLQGYTGCIFLQDRKVQIKFKMKHQKGSVAFYNTTQNPKAASDDVFFSGVAITAMRRGPLEIDGSLAHRERGLMRTAESWKDPNEAGRAKHGADGSEELAGEGVAAEVATTQWSSSAKPPGVTASTAAPSDSAAFSFAAQTTSSGTQFRSPQQGSGTLSTQRSPDGMRSTAPSLARSRLAGAGGSMAATSRQQWPGGGMSQKGRLRQSASDGALRKSGGHLKSSMTLTRHGGGGDGWVPLATNAPKREQDLMQGVIRRDLEKSNCKDFIAM